MRLFQKVKDGGPDSPVDAYVLIEIKSLFSIMLLKFNKGGREVYHNHAFNALTWFICGEMYEQELDHEYALYKYKRSLIPKLTPRSNMHRVRALKDSWALTLRGRWKNTWLEWNGIRYVKLTHGRREVEF